MKKFKVTYKTDNSIPDVITADYLKYDQGVALFIMESENPNVNSRIVSVVNTETIKSIVEFQ